MTHEQRLFAALGDPTRRTVLQRLTETGAASATTLSAELPMSRQALVKHLAALDAAGLVTRVRHGREIRYSVTPGPLTDVVRWVVEVGGAWDERLARLRDVIEEA